MAVTSTAANPAAVARGPRCLPASFLARTPPRAARLDRVAVEVTLDVRRQTVGRLVAPRGPSPWHFITIQSRSPRQLRQPGRFGAPLAAIDAAGLLSRQSRVLGLGGSSSRIRRRISAKPASRSSPASSGVVPVKSS